MARVMFGGVGGGKGGRGSLANSIAGRPKAGGKGGVGGGLGDAGGGLGGEGQTFRGRTSQTLAKSAPIIEVFPLSDVTV